MLISVPSDVYSYGKSAGFRYLELVYEFPFFHRLFLPFIKEIAVVDDGPLFLRIR